EATRRVEEVRKEVRPRAARRIVRLEQELVAANKAVAQAQVEGREQRIELEQQLAQAKAESAREREQRIELEQQLAQAKAESARERAQRIELEQHVAELEQELAQARGAAEREREKRIELEQ